MITIDSKKWHENNINLYLDNYDDEMLAINILFKKNIDFKDSVFKLASKIKRPPNLPILVLKNEYGDEKNYTSDRIFNDYWDSIQISEEDLNKVKIFIKDLKIKAAAAEMEQAAAKAAEMEQAKAAEMEQAVVEREEIMLAEAERGKKKLAAEAEMKQAVVEREKRKLVAIQEFCWTIPGLFEIYNNTNHSETSKERLVDNVKKLKFFSSITLEDIREKCMLNHHLDIDSGRKTLTTLEDCEQYWHQYSKFIPQQWDYFFKEHEKIIADTCSKTVQIVDYGCGQGLATLKLLDKFFKNDKTQILDITLIEKSPLTLLLAKIFLSAHSPEIDLARVKSINKEVDNISTDYFESDPKAVTIHLFSNILDMGVVVPDKLLIKINKFKGKHLFLTVSQGGNWNNGLSKFEDFCEHLYMPKYKFKAIEPRIPAEQFTIQAATKEMNVISSMALMEVIE